MIVLLVLPCVLGGNPYVTCLTGQVANQLDELTLDDTPHEVFYQSVKAATSSSKQQVQWDWMETVRG